MRLAKYLGIEVQENRKRINDFCNGIDDQVVNNQNKRPVNWTYRPNFLNPVTTIYNSSPSTFFSLFNKYEPTVSQNLVDYYSKCEAASTLLSLYRNRYMGNDPLTHNTPQDPHISFKAQYTSMGLRALENDFIKLGAAIEKIKTGNKFWIFIKKPRVYKLIALGLGILLIFVPEREAI